MILGEGTVFASLLVLGLHRIERNMRRERARLARERNMLLGVTHELKTPLANVQLGVDTLRRLALNEDDRSAVLDNMQSGVRDLERRVEDMLVATRLQRLSHVHAEAFSWSEMTREAAERLTGMSEGRIRLDAEVEASDAVRGDRALWTLAATNVIENALKYAKGEVRVKAKASPNQVVLEVEDQGQGIAIQDRQAALSPFVRLHEGGSGTGLGLHLVSQTAELHGASLEMERLKPGGFVVRLVWPQGN